MKMAIFLITNFVPIIIINIYIYVGVVFVIMELLYWVFMCYFIIIIIGNFGWVFMGYFIVIFS